MIRPSPNEIEQRTLDSARTGFFMQVPFLSVNGTGSDPDPVRRGIAVDEQVLCLTIEEGHATAVPPVLPPLLAGQTNRTRLEQLTAGCGSCHTKVIDPPGFAFEGFDTTFRVRAEVTP